MSSCVKVVYTLFWFSYKFSKRIYMHIKRTENRTGVHVRQPDVHNCTPEIIQFDHFPWAPSPPCINAMSEQFLIWFLFSVFLSLAGKRLSVNVNCNRNLLKSGRSMTVTREDVVCYQTPVDDAPWSSASLRLVCTVSAPWDRVVI